MRFSDEKPPIYDQCVQQFGVDWEKGVIFTYGDTVYCKYILNEDKIVHEQTHIDQQKKMGAEEWWDRYLDDREFRFEQEKEAYINEVRFVKKTVKDKNKQASFIIRLAFDLSSSMYGKIVSYNEALRILNNAK